MSKDNPLLSVRMEGEAIGSSRVGVSHLMHLLKTLDDALLRTGQVVQGEADSMRRGPKGKSLKEEIALDLVLFTHGSSATVIGFERRAQPSLPGLDTGITILQRALYGLATVQEPDPALPMGFDSGVLMAWRNMGSLFEKGCSLITFTLNHSPQPLISKYTLEGFHRIKQRIQGPITNVRTIEGRLLMADFKEHGTRCRVHPSVGEPVLCLFGEEQKDEVLEDILHYVRIVGEAKEDPMTGRITSIKIHDIQRLEDKENEQAELLPQGTPLPTDFWQSPTLEQLAEAQDIRPIQDISALFGSWPGEIDDGFEESILDKRHQSLARRSKQ